MAHIVKSAKSLKCPACHARRGEHCTVPTDTGRKGVTWHHLARDQGLVAIRNEPDRCHDAWGYHVDPHKECILR